MDKDTSGCGVYSFAFCKDGCSRPFALTGMRHVMYKHMIELNNQFGDVARGFLDTAEGTNSSGILGTIHQYPMSRDIMLEVRVPISKTGDSISNHTPCLKLFIVSRNSRRRRTQPRRRSTTGRGKPLSPNHKYNNCM